MTCSVTVVGYHLMPEKVCRMVFLQQILRGEKKCLLQKDVKRREVPHWPQLQIKDIYLEALEKFPELVDYMPDSDEDPKSFPPRVFFFAVLSTLRPIEMEKLIQDAAASRVPRKENLQEQKWKMAATDEWMDRLLQYEFVSTKKGRGTSSILISGVGRAHSKKR